MAGSASRIQNFCHSFPNSSGCPFPPLVNQPAPKVCDDFPFEIGTTNSCSVYNVFWLKDEYSEAVVNIPDWSGPNSSGNEFHLIAPLYSGIYTPSGPKNKIGYLKLFTTQTKYDTDEPVLNTDYYFFIWTNEGQIVASMDSIYDYIGTESNPFFQPNTTHNMNSTATNAHQLLNKRLSIRLFAGTNERQCKLTFKV